MAEVCRSHGVLLIADEVMTGFGRTGAWFACEHWGVRPDIMVCGKGCSSGYWPMGLAVASGEVFDTVRASGFIHGFTFGGHPICAAVAMANLDVLEREGVLENVRANEGALRGMLESLRDLPIVGDVRGAGYFHAIELVKDKETKESFDDEESETLLRGFLSGELYRRGLICRADDRGDPVIQLSPPLVAGQAEFDTIAEILGDVLQEAWNEL